MPTPQDLGTTQVRLAEMIGRLTPVVEGMIAWFRGPADGVVNNGSVDLPTLAHLIAAADPAGLTLTGDPLDVEAADVDVPEIANAGVKAVTSALLQLIEFLRSDKLSIADFDADATLAANSDMRVASQKAVRTFVENMLVALWRDRGNYDASSDLWPSTGGTGAGGSIKAGNFWTVSVGGALGGTDVGVGDTFRALVDDPGQTAGNWAVLEGNIGYVPLNAASNLTDLASVSAARTALELGALAVASIVSTALLQDKAVTLAKLQDIATASILGRKSAGSGAPEVLTLSDLLDLIGSAAQGDMLYRGASGWARLAAGGANKFLQSNGAAPPTWEPKPIASTVVMKAIDQSVANSTTLVDDDALKMQLDANKKYLVRLRVVGAPATAVSMAWAISGPASPVKVESAAIGQGTSASIDIDSSYPSGNAAVGTVSSGNGCVLEISMYIENGSNAGDLIFQWAQLAAKATALVVKAGSWLEWREVA